MVISFKCPLFKVVTFQYNKGLWLQKDYRKLKFSLYEENKAEAVQDTERSKPYGSATEQVCRNIHLKKKRTKRRRKATECLSLHRRPGATEKETFYAHFTGRGRTSQPEVVLLPRPGLCSRIGWSHVELHVLDLPTAQATKQVVDLSPGDLPVVCEDTSQCWVVNESMSSARPPPGGAIRTSHPRLRLVCPPTSSPTPGASPVQKPAPLKIHLESSAGHSEATSQYQEHRRAKICLWRIKQWGCVFFLGG